MFICLFRFNLLVHDVCIRLVLLCVNSIQIFLNVCVRITAKIDNVYLQVDFGTCSHAIGFEEEDVLTGADINE